jgi:hypothetical protein
MEEWVMAEKLGIKIEGPVRIGIMPPEGSNLSAGYVMLLIFSFLFVLAALGLLAADIMDLPFVNNVYQLISRYLPISF